MLEFVTRHRIFVCEEWWFEIDEFTLAGEQHLLAHLRIAHWSPSVFKHILSIWATFRSVVKAPLFSYGEIDDRKWKRFMTHLGFKPHTTVLCNDGLERSLYLSKVD